MDIEMENDNSNNNINNNIINNNNNNNNNNDTAVEFTFTDVELDIEYEYNAPRFYDFAREESVNEAREAEMWFASAASYPPSPFALRLLSREQSGNASCSTSSKGPDNAPEDSSMALSNTDGDVANEGVPLDLKNYCLQALQNPESTSAVFKESLRNTNYKSKTKSSWKLPFSRTSTLMKPTASQLAKQNLDRLMDDAKFPKLGNNSSVVESQAAKRQKLDRGHLYKVTDTNQQANFVHKAPKREGNIDSNLGRGRLRITVPRPPYLATAQRAQRIRRKDNSGNEHVATRAPGFRARPLNRKIFEAPSFLPQKSTPQLPEFQEFHLKTSERAVQNIAAEPSTSACCNINSKAPQKPGFAFGIQSSCRESKGPHVAGAPKQEDCETIHRFKALPLNTKILSSKGDLGVFRSSKRETTVAMVFNFQTEKRAHHAPPVDLFNKLSLASKSDTQSNKPRLSRVPSILSKGSKENRVPNMDQNRFISTVEN